MTQALVLIGSLLPLAFCKSPSMAIQCLRVIKHSLSTGLSCWLYFGEAVCREMIRFASLPVSLDLCLLRKSRTLFQCPLCSMLERCIRRRIPSMLGCTASTICSPETNLTD